MKTISIVNYGLGNIHSIQHAIDYLGFKSNLVSTPREINQASHLILPGVGAYPYAMKLLKENDLDRSILEYSDAEKPILGICLGMQLLFEESNENSFSQGLHILSGKVKRYKFNEDYCIPQIQWNELVKQDDCLIMSGVKDREYFYFVNSYCVDISSIKNSYKICISNYSGQNFLGLVEHKNITGVQFHPEKSGINGLMLLKNFIKK